MRTFTAKQLLGVLPIALLCVVGLIAAGLAGDLVAAVVVALVAVVALLTYYVALSHRQNRADQRVTLRRLQRLETRLEKSAKQAETGRRAARKRDEAGARRLDQVGSHVLARQDQVASALTRLTAEVQEEVAALAASNARAASQDGSLKTLLEGQARQITTLRRDLAALEVGEHGGSLRKRLVTDVAALFAMHGDEVGSLLPAPSDWAMSPRVLEAVLRVVRTRPSVTTVVELGSGVSTPWISRALTLRGSGRLVSLEHDSHYAAITAGQLRAAGLDGPVDLRCAPLAPVEVGGESFRWYQGFEDLADIDLLVVDGPPGGTGPQARYPALPLLLDKMADGGIVVLDDATRDDERCIIDRWLALGEPGRPVRLLEMVDRAAVFQVGGAAQA